MRSLCLLLVLTGVACDSFPSHQVFVVGQVYDGATGDRLTAYALVVHYRDQTIRAEVSPSGRFIVRNLPVYQDYTVEIVANGYRAFLSHNPMFMPPALASLSSSSQSTTQTFYFDAYLFPSSLVAPALTLNVRKLTSTGELASGTARIRPVAASVLDDTAPELPVGVGNQLWSNDEDLQGKPIQRDFTGTIDLAAGELVYGVRYQVSIYEVDGYQPSESFITAGIDGTRTIVLQEEQTDPLTLVNNTASSCLNPIAPTDTQAGVMTFEFNFDIQLGASMYAGGVEEQVDDLFSITSNDSPFNGVQNRLQNDASSTVRERGTSITINGKILTFAWNPSVGLASPRDPADPIVVHWNVSTVPIQPLNRPGAMRTLGSLFPQAGFINCN